MLHGRGVESKSFDSLVTQLPDEVIVRVDFPGFGGSPVPKLVRWITEYAACIQSLLQKLTLANHDIVLLGHSFGGRVAIELASKNEYRKLILIGSSGVQQTLPTSTKILHHLVSPLKKGFARLGMKERYETIAKTWRSADYNATTGIMREIFLKTISYDQTHLLKQISCPTLIIHGDADTETPIEYAYIFHREIPNARLEIMKWIGHFPFQEDPKKVAEYIEKFL